MTVRSTSSPTAAGAHLEQHENVKPFKHAAVAQLCYFVLGTGLLTGWNAFLTASDYFNAVLPGRNIDRVFTVTYLPITLCLIGLVSLWPRLVWSGSGRIAAGYCLFTLCCAAVPVIDVFLLQQGSVDAAYDLVLLCVVLTAVGDGITQPTVYADAAVLPDKYTQSVVMGAAASGVSMGALRCITKGATPQTLEGVRISAQAYFAVSAAITAAALLLYMLVLPRLDVVQYYRGKLQEDQCSTANGSAAGAAASRQGGCSHSDVCSSVSQATPGTCSHQQQTHQQHSAGSMQCRTGSQAVLPALSAACTAAHAGADSKDIEAGLQSLHELASGDQQLQQQCDGACQPRQQLDQCIGQKVQQLTPKRQPQTQQQQHQQQGSSLRHGTDPGQTAQRLSRGEVTWLHILALNWRLCVAVFMTYCVTLSIFPGFLAENVHSAALGGWYPVLLIFTFNIFDFLGRCIPEACWYPSHTTLLALALCRLALIPLYAGLAVYGASETAFFCLTAVLGSSNGWLTSLIFCAAPRGLSPSGAETAGMINVLAELAGLNAGAYLGWLWTIGKA